jgi:hypothetical protein
MELFVGDDFENSMLKFRQIGDFLLDKTNKFIQHKFQNPANGSIPGKYPGFGDNDKMFASKGKFSNRIDNISHAHLTSDISIVYRISGNGLYLYGVYNHDTIGTGQPPNRNRQEQSVEKWSNTSFKAVPANAFATSDKKPAQPEKSKSAPSSYAPKAKPTVQAVVDKILPLVQKADRAYPQRNLLAQYQSAPNKQAFASVVAKEVRTIQDIRQQGRTLYPNQIEYFQTLYNIAKEL